MNSKSTALWGKLLLAALLGSMTLTGCSLLCGKSVDRVYMIAEPQSEADVDKMNAEFKEISLDGFRLKKSWADSLGGKAVRYWHFRRPAEGAPMPAGESSMSSESDTSTSE
jgi:hypothetical protein